MPRQKWTGRLDAQLCNLMKEKAVDLVRSEAFIVETALGEMFRDRLPPGWRAGAKNEDTTETRESGGA